MYKVKQVEVEKDYITLKFHQFGEGEPKFLLVAGIHGDEVTGILAAMKIIDELKERKVNGTVTLLPIANPLAFRLRERATMTVGEFENPDMNRSFPGSKDGNITERTAYEIWKVVLESNYVVDLHCCMRDSYPFMIAFEDDYVKKLSSNFPVKAVLKTRGFVSEGVGHGGSLSGTAVKNGISSVNVELRGGDSRVNVEDADMLKDSFMKLLVNLGFLEGKKTTVKHESFGEIARVRADHDGFFIQKIAPGTMVKKGTVLGEIFNIGTVISPHEGIVTHIIPSSAVFKGDLISWIPKKL
jgi:predicted deacylase